MTSTVDVDLDACAREPVHLVGTIQAHGLLFALSEPDFVVRQVSANIAEVLGSSPQAVLGAPFETLIGAAQFEIFVARLRSDDLNPASAFRITLGPAGELNCIAHRHDDVLIVEMESVRGLHAIDASELAGNIQIMLSRMERASTVLDYAEVAASEIARVSGFARVMVYRFDPEWNGEVIAECCGNPIPDPLGSQPTSYLGLHFPASDIPPQARRLFVTNPVRAIADIGSEPVPLVPVIGPLTGRPLDMTHTFLRSPSPVHVEYLRNMGVAASLAISIVVDERLWGVIACHHYAPRPIDCLTRSVCELIARNLSLQITLRNSNAMWHARQAARKLVDGYAEHLEQVDGRVDGASLQDSLFLDLMDADGMVAYIDGVVTLHGTTVEHDALLPVIGKLRESATRGIAGSNNLSALDPGANAFATDVSGALLLDLGKRSKDYVLFVRSEFIRSVDWAGNPDKSVGADVHGKLHPRASFAAWRQTVRGRARPWTDVELDGALFLREQLCHLRDLARIRELEAQDVDDGGGA